MRARIIKESFIEEVRFLLIFGDWWCLVRCREVLEWVIAMVRYVDKGQTKPAVRGLIVISEN